MLSRAHSLAFAPDVWLATCFLTGSWDLALGILGVFSEREAGVTGLPLPQPDH